MERSKTGKDFEELVTYIHRCLHQKAVITPNDKIRDIHSNRLRQIDISIRLKDGPTDFLGIVEIRDRSRPVAVDYIEQISEKRKSVGADAAFIISSSGFYDAAKAKAQSLNIRLFTYKEAVSSDWMQCLQLREMNQFIRRWGNVLITFLNPLTNCVILPHQSTITALTENSSTLIFETDKGELKNSIPQIASAVINQNIENVFGDVQVGKLQRKGFSVNLQIPKNEPPLFFRDVNGALIRLERFHLLADFWIEASTVPVILSKYSNEGTGEAIAEIASATIDIWGGPHKLDLLANISEENGTQVMMRLQKQDTLKN